MNPIHDYYAKHYPWLNADQRECFDFLCDIHGGANHMFGKIQASGEHGLFINSKASHYMSTFDYSNLTKAVVIAHDRMIRFQIEPSGPRMLKFIAHKRHTREGDMSECHPAMEEAIRNIRKQYPYSEVKA
ncbi:MAG: hypothetical protein V7690_05470 [Shewanella sp.]|uniref:hypothetical protein n=1 Tax=Shewanella sp. TaxID=50422 RepID=UPI003002C0F9